MRPFFIFLFLLFSATLSFAQNDSAGTQNIDGANTQMPANASTAPPPVQTQISTAIADTNNSFLPPQPTDLAYKPMTYLFALLPAAFFIVLMVVGLGALKKFNLREALTENDEAKITVVNPAYNPATLVQMASKDATMIPSVLPATIEITNTFFRPDAMPAASVTVTENPAADADTDQLPAPPPAPPLTPAPVNDLNVPQINTDAGSLTTTNVNISIPAPSTDAATAGTSDTGSGDSEASTSGIQGGQKITSITPNAIPVKPKMTASEYADAIQKVKGNYRPSSSRLIAFFSSVITLTLATCLSCFFIYYYISFGKAPDLSGLSAVLIALGLGVVPYASNKIATAVTNKKPNSY
ncbi:hypothetical protein [Taibaiella soli]|uniref:Uncharacterized protein n=1 Tax=Taibaiella soli TaxID=1649169 RepID=A0A2W2APX5_9BACT|nr:hypothetical protein [Taibaiella soli]PZF74460.1 hypothetical protein DN068_02445 [Taibaiella soli]